MCAQKGSQISYGVVAIGRNEGERLKVCLRSLQSASRVVYVDSGSTDGSASFARSVGATVVELDSGLPFTAARARNAGFKCLLADVPSLAYLQFIDGDCELIETWPQQALSFLVSNPSACAVSGRRRERFPRQSIYNQLCDWEWEGPEGACSYFGGDVMIRVSAFGQIAGYREDLIAGEEPELCVRLRGAGWYIWRLNAEMTLHDAAMIRFSQWWWRTVRGGYAFAQGASLHGRAPERHWLWESRRTLLWGIWLPVVCILVSLTLGGWGWLVWLIYPLQILRQTTRNRGSIRDRVALAVFQVLARFPEGLGYLSFILDTIRRRKARIIEYK